MGRGQIKFLTCFICLSNFVTAPYLPVHVVVVQPSCPFVVTVVVVNVVVGVAVVVVVSVVVVATVVASELVPACVGAYVWQYHKHIQYLAAVPGWDLYILLPNFSTESRIIPDGDFKRKYVPHPLHTYMTQVTLKIRSRSPKSNHIRGPSNDVKSVPVWSKYSHWLIR